MHVTSLAESSYLMQDLLVIYLMINNPKLATLTGIQNNLREIYISDKVCGLAAGRMSCQSA